MKTGRFAAGLTALASLAFLLGLAPADGEPGPVGMIELVVRTSKGTPLANTAIEVRPDSDYHPFRVPPPVQCNTDGKGMARFAWPARTPALPWANEGPERKENDSILAAETVPTR